MDFIPKLWFVEEFIDQFKYFDDRGLRVSKTITYVLLCHNGPIHKFTRFINLSSIYNIAIESINMWICFLSTRDIKYLELVNFDSGHEQMPYPILSFSCKKLTYLRLSGFNLSIPPNICGFKRLLELSL